MKVEEIIEKDKVREVREDFYNGIMKKMARNKVDDAGPGIRKRHLGMSIARNCTRHSGGQYTPPHTQDRSASGNAGVARKV